MIARAAEPGGVRRLASESGERRVDILGRTATAAAQTGRLDELAQILAQASSTEVAEVRKFAANIHEGIGFVIDRGAAMAPPLRWRLANFYRSSPGRTWLIVGAGASTAVYFGYRATRRARR